MRAKREYRRLDAISTRIAAGRPDELTVVLFITGIIVLVASFAAWDSL